MHNNQDFYFICLKLLLFIFILRLLTENLEWHIYKDIINKCDNQCNASIDNFMLDICYTNCTNLKIFKHICHYNKYNKKFKYNDKFKYCKYN